jgi:hypothetical protein
MPLDQPASSAGNEMYRAWSKNSSEQQLLLPTEVRTITFRHLRRFTTIAIAPMLPTLAPHRRCDPALFPATLAAAAGHPRRRPVSGDLRVDVY